MSFKLVSRSVWQNPGNRGRRWQRTLSAVAWQARKRLSRSPRLLRLANGVRFHAWPDCVVSSALIYADWPEFAELMFLRRSLRPGELVLDVGANVGHISLLLSDVVGPANLYAFEPTPVTFARLVENWELNGWPTGQLFQVAVGASRGSVYVPDVSHPLTTNAVTRDARPGGTVQVPLVPLDDYLPLFSGRRIGLLKIDIEGFEAEAFHGAPQLLNQERPRLIMFESLEGKLHDDVRQILEQSQYVLFQLDRGGRPDFERLAAQNLFAVPAEELDDLHERSEPERGARQVSAAGSHA